MNVCYYNNQVKEELDGACSYAQMAIKLKSEHPDWAKIYLDMSVMELSHADNLIKIFEDDFKRSKTDDLIWEQMRSSLLDMYSEFTAKVKYMHQKYTTI